MYKHIIWDFDGTLFDTYPVMGIVFKEMLAEEGIEEPMEEILKHMKISMTHAFKHYSDKYPITKTFAEAYKVRRNQRESELCKPYAGIKELCEHIQATGRFNYLYTHRSNTAITYLRNHGLYDYFRDFITSEDDFERKPSPEAIQYFIDKYQMKPEEAIMIGDRDLDILSAKNAGIAACFFTDSIGECDAADYNINDIQGIYPIINS